MIAAYAPPPEQQVLAAARAPKPDTTVRAPAPQVDRFPAQLGANITLTYLASVYRSALTGYRQGFVDLLGELFDYDPDVVQLFIKRALAVAGAKFELLPAKLPPGDPDEELAQIIRDDCVRQWDSLPMRSQTLCQLMWGVCWGVSGGENHWARTAEGWDLKRISFLHSRRLSYIDPQSWDVFVWDGGASAWGAQTAATGLRCADYPGKFVIHAPQLRAEYPTRDGIGRVVGCYLAIKRLVIRVSAADFERFVKPWVIAWARTESDNDPSKPRVASTADVADADLAIRSLGAGTLSGAVLPDSIRIELLKAVSALSQSEFLDYLDASSAKAIQGQTFTTQTGKYGSRSTADVGQKGVLMLARYDACCLCDTLERDVFAWMVRYNYPGFEHLTPLAKLQVEDAPDPAVVGANIAIASKAGFPIDVDANAGAMSITLLPNDTGAPRGPEEPDPVEAPPPDGAAKDPAAGPDGVPGTADDPNPESEAP